MLTNRHKFATGIVLAAVVAAGGSAFTQGGITGIADASLGAKRIAVTGAVATSVAYTYSSNLLQVDAITVVFTGDIHTMTLKVTPTYNATPGDNSSAATAGTEVTCATGVYSSPSTTFACDTSAAGTAAEWQLIDLANIDYKLS